MNRFIFTNFTKRKFKKLSPEIQDFILKKLKNLKEYDELKSLLKKLNNFAPATHRIRIGNYRLILEKRRNNLFVVLDIGHRKNIYN